MVNWKSEKCIIIGDCKDNCRILKLFSLTGLFGGCCDGERKVVTGDQLETTSKFSS